MGIVMQPWKLLANYGSYIFGWLVGYSGFLGPIAGVLICDYFVLRRKQLSIVDLYQRGGEYEYSRGINWNAMAALAAGCGAAFLGLIYEPMRVLYNYAWFVGFAVGFSAYYSLMKLMQVAPATRQKVWSGIAALAAGCGVAILGLIYEPLKFLYSYAWFVGFGVSIIVYFALIKMIATAMRPTR
jgi:NCS1 family nucleobase:cation symporter-1